MKKGFTLLELLVVIGIMGLLGTMSIGGYRAATRGMADRTAVDNASMFMRGAYQRALIDRQPTVVWYWNETVQEETDYKDIVVQGRAVAVRRSGRITSISGNYLFDEFADLNFTYRTDESSSSVKSGTMNLYPMDNINNPDAPSLVYDTVHRNDPASGITETYLLNDDSGVATKEGGNLDTAPTDSGALEMSAFIVADGSQGNWKPGDSYGFEFQNLKLPAGYIFGDQFSEDTSNPVKGKKAVAFNPFTTSSSATVEIYALRPNASGVMTAQKVGTTKSPTEEIK